MRHLALSLLVVSCAEDSVVTRSPTPEPIRASPRDPSPGDETPHRDYFAPYDATAHTWNGNVEAERPQADWKAVNEAYVAASQRRSARSRAEAAANELGMTTSPATLGVVR